MSMRPGKSGPITLSVVDSSRMQYLLTRSSRLKREIAQRFTPQGAPCYCGSGQKFKRCHGSPVKGNK